MTTPNAELIERFYSAFGRHDGDAMAACYTPDAKFHDPAFGDLHGEEPGAMWRMLTERADDLEIELVDHAAQGDTGRAHWLAHYTFGQTGRHVDNDVTATFRFRDGLIADHRDDFGFHCLVASGAGSAGTAARLDPDHQERRAQEGPRPAAGVPRARARG